MDFLKTKHLYSQEHGCKNMTVCQWIWRRWHT